MKENQISGGRSQEFANNVRKTWGKFTDDEIDNIDGKRDFLIKQIQLKYGTTRQVAEQKVNNFELEYHT